MLKENEVQFQTFFPARLLVRHDDGTKIYDTMEEAAEDLLRRGYTVVAPKPLETLMEQVQRLTWRRVDRRATRGTTKSGREPGYMEKF